MFPSMSSELFRRCDISYNFRSNSSFAKPNVKSVFHGSDIISYLGRKIWSVAPLDLKELTSLNALKKVLKMATKKLSL